MKNLIILFLAISFIGCAHDKYNAKFPTVKNNQRNVVISQAKFDIFELPVAGSSYIGDISVKGDSIYFIDNYFCSVFTFDKDGHFGSRHLGQGRGPQEIPTGRLEGFAFLNNGDYFFIGAGHDCHLYNKDFNTIKHFTLNIGTLGKDLTYENPASYMLNYGKLVMRNYDNYLYYTVHTEKQGLWYHDNPEGYVNEMHILAKMNLDDGVVKELLGWLSPFYALPKHLSHCDYPYFDLDAKGRFYICYEADPIIYVYDNNFTPIEAYGYEGSKMNTHYTKSPTEDSYNDAYENDSKKCGYYTWLEYIDELNILLRSYTRGEEQSNDGLQLYKDGVLIGDVDVPKGYKIIGYIAPYIYGSIINEENEKITIYRFTL